jgi:cytochrome c oxidase subunit 4
VTEQRATAPMHTMSPIIYVGVLVALVLFTLLTVAVSFANLSASQHFLIGVSIGIVKALLVGLFFMHLIHSRPATWAVVVVTLFWFVVVLTVLIFSDYATRPSIPFTPGH